MANYGDANMGNAVASTPSGGGRYLSKLQRLMLIKGKADSERSSFLAHWRDLSDYVLPMRGRFNLTDRNRGDRRSTKIIDSTATLALRTLKSGMVSGLSSPTRPWFLLTTADPEMARRPAVKRWLEDVRNDMLVVMARSNFYAAADIVYGDVGLFGTAAMMISEDTEDVIRCEVFPIGSYSLAQSATRRIDTICREYELTARQLMDAFGWDNLSSTAQNMIDVGNGETVLPIVHIIYPNPDWNPRALESKYKRFSECIWEQAGVSEDKFLRETGYDQFPVMAPRWETAGQDIWGTNCPGMTALGDIKQLQAMQRRAVKAVDKMTDPPLVGGPGIKGKVVSLLPGAVTVEDALQGGTTLKPIHETQMRLEALEIYMDQCRQRISRCFYEDLFLMLAQSDRREITAREIDERHEEKLLALGPVVENEGDDFHDPAIDRIFGIMLRQNKIQPAPPELAGEDLRVEYISVMAQAQKLAGVAALERHVSFLGNVVAATGSQAVLDTTDLDEVMVQHASMTGVSPKVSRSPDEIAALRDERDKAQQAQQLAAATPGLATAAQKLSNTKMDEPDSGLQRLLASVQGT